MSYICHAITWIMIYIFLIEHRIAEVIAVDKMDIEPQCD